MGRLQTYWRLPRYEWSDPSLMGSLMMMSPLRILILYRHDGLVQTHALYSMEAPWLPKSESGTRSPSPHLRHRGNAFSTKSPPSFFSGGYYRLTYIYQARLSEKVSRWGSLRRCIRIPTAGLIHAFTIIPQLFFSVSRYVKKSSFSSRKRFFDPFTPPAHSVGLLYSTK